MPPVMNKVLHFCSLVSPRQAVQRGPSSCGRRCATQLPISGKAFAKCCPGSAHKLISLKIKADSARHTSQQAQDEQGSS